MGPWLRWTAGTNSGTGHRRPSFYTNTAFSARWFCRYDWILWHSSHEDISASFPVLDRPLWPLAPTDFCFKIKPSTFVALICTFSYWRTSHNPLSLPACRNDSNHQPSTPRPSRPGRLPAPPHPTSTASAAIPPRSQWPSISAIHRCYLLCMPRKCGSQDSLACWLHHPQPPMLRHKSTAHSQSRYSTAGSHPRSMHIYDKSGPPALE